MAWLNAVTDGHAAAAPPRTVVLSGQDLSTLWSDPEPARVWQDVLAFTRSSDPAQTPGARLRRPGGEEIYQDNDFVSVDAELTDGSSKLVQLTRRDPANPAEVWTMFYDLDAKSAIKIGDSDRISGGGLTAALSDGKLFVDGHNRDNSQFGFGVWNLRGQQWDFLKNRDDARELSLAKVAFFEDHLYLTGSGGTFSVIALPAGDPVASNWALRPFQRISGWTRRAAARPHRAPTGSARRSSWCKTAMATTPGRGSDLRPSRAPAAPCTGRSRWSPGTARE